MSTLDRCDFDFGLGEELDEVRAQVRRFARERIAPRAEHIDRSNEFPRDLWPELGDALRTQVLLDADGVIGAALHRRIVANHHAFTAGNAPDAGDDAGAGRFFAVHAESGERRQLEERRARVQQHLHAIAGQQFAARHVFGSRRIPSTQRAFHLAGLQFGDQRAHGRFIGGEFSTFPIDFGFEQRHDCRTIVHSYI